MNKKDDQIPLVYILIGIAIVIALVSYWFGAPWAKDFESAAIFAGAAFFVIILILVLIVSWRDS